MSCVLYRPKGVYNKVHLVMDLKGFYYLAAEYVDCIYCSKTNIAYDDRWANTAYYINNVYIHTYL